MINEDVRPCKVLSFFQRFHHHLSFENSLTLLRNGTSTWLRRVKYYKYVKSDLCYNITWGNCNYRPSSVYFILVVLFFPFFLYFISISAFWSGLPVTWLSCDRRAHGRARRHFLLLFFCKSKQFFNVQGHVHCVLKVTSLVQVQEAVFRE